MKIKSDKKNLIFLIILLLTLIGGVWFIYSVMQPYRKIYQYCENKTKNGLEMKSCRLFLKEVYSEKDNSCFLITLPEGDPTKREVKICIEKDKFNAFLESVAEENDVIQLINC